MCVRGFLPLTLPSKPLLGAERGQNPPLLPRQMGSEGCRPGDPAEPPPLPSTPSQGTKPWVGGWKSPSDLFVHRKDWAPAPQGLGATPPPQLPTLPAVRVTLYGATGP